MPHHANGGSFTAKDWVGFRNERLVAIKDTGEKNKKGCHMWLCRCDCGNEVIIPAFRLRRVKSCGCLNRVKLSYSNMEEEHGTEDMDGEEWKVIDGFENYMISNKGRVKSLNYLGKGVVRIMEPAKDNKGYYRIGLWQNRKKSTRKIHRLVAEAFIENPECKPEVNHKDGCKGNNCVDNLEWVTAHENIKHAYESGLKEENRKWAKDMGETCGREALNRYLEKHKVPVLVIRDEDGERFVCCSQAEAQKITGVNQSVISSIVNQKTKWRSKNGYSFYLAGEVSECQK